MHENSKISLYLFGMTRRGYGDLLRNARERAGLTQQELAERIGSSASTVSNLEREQHPPTVPDQVNVLASALPLSVEELLRAMGVNIVPVAAARLPRELVTSLLALSPDRQAALLAFVRGLQEATRPVEPPP